MSHALSNKNCVTGDTLVTRASTKVYKENWDRIFGKKDAEPVAEEGTEAVQMEGGKASGLITESVDPLVDRLRNSKAFNNEYTSERVARNIINLNP